MPASSTKNRGSFGDFRKPDSRPVSPRTISPDGRRQVPPGSRVPVIDPPDPQRGWQPPPNALHQKHFAPQSDGFDRMEGPERMLENPAAKRQSKEKSHGLFGDCQQHPIVVRPPFLFEIRAFDADKFATSRVVDKDCPSFPIDSCHHDVMQRGAALSRLETHDQRPALLKLLLEVLPFPVEMKNAKAGAFQIAFHVRSVDSVSFS